MVTFEDILPKEASEVEVVTAGFAAQHFIRGVRAVLVEVTAEAVVDADAVRVALEVVWAAAPCFVGAVVALHHPVAQTSLLEALAIGALEIAVRAHVLVCKTIPKWRIAG